MAVLTRGTKTFLFAGNGTESSLGLPSHVGLALLMKGSTTNPRWPTPDSREAAKPLSREEIHVRLKTDLIADGHQVTDAEVAAILDQLYAFAELIVRDHLPS